MSDQYRINCPINKFITSLRRSRYSKARMESLALGVDDIKWGSPDMKENAINLIIACLIVLEEKK